MLFESALVLTPVILVLNLVLSRRIKTLEEAVDRHTQLYLTRSELVSELDTLSRKLDVIEHKVDISSMVRFNREEK